MKHGSSFPDHVIGLIVMVSYLPRYDSGVERRISSFLARCSKFFRSEFSDHPIQKLSIVKKRRILHETTRDLKADGKTVGVSSRGYRKSRHTGMSPWSVESSISGLADPHGCAPGGAGCEPGIDSFLRGQRLK